MAHYPVRGHTPQRAAQLPCCLRPPLRLAWWLQYSGAFDVTRLPLVEGGHAFFKRPKDGWTTAATEGSAEEVWVYDKVGTADLIHEDRLFTWPDEGRAHLLDVASGELISTIECPAAQSAAAIGTTLVGTSYQNRRKLIYAVDLSTSRMRWQVVVPQGMNGLFAIDAERMVFGREKSLTIALSLDAGHELWSHSLADLTWQDGRVQRAGHLQGAVVIYRDLAIVEVVKHYVVALSLKDGHRVWTWHLPDVAVWQAYLYGDRYYVIGGFGSYHVLDAATGRVIFERDLRETLPKKLSDANPHAPLLISETHAFTGSLGPHVMAFDRETGDFAWSHAAKGGGSTSHGGAYFMSVNGRLYYGDMAFRVYCLEEEEPTDPVLKVQRSEADKRKGWFSR